MIRTIVALSLSLPLLGTITAAQAETLYKCVGKGGSVSYQSAPCEAGQRTARTRDYTPEPPPTAAQLRAARERAQRDRAESDYLSRLAGTNGNGRSRPSGTTIAPQADHARCERAKAERQRRLDAAGLSRNFDLLSRLDEQVRAACK